MESYGSAPTASKRRISHTYDSQSRLVRRQFTKSLEQGYDNGEVVDTDDNHVEVWPKLQSALPQLRVLEYEDAPRGRVLFHKVVGHFRVYTDKRLHLQHVKRKIVTAFELPASTTDFLTDPHYTTDEAELKLLFDRA